MNINNIVSHSIKIIYFFTLKKKKKNQLFLYIGSLLNDYSRSVINCKPTALTRHVVAQQTHFQ